MHGLPRWLSRKESTCQAGDTRLTPGLGRSPGEENGNPLQYSCLGNPMDRGAWQATVHGWGHMELDMTERLNHNKYIPCNMPATGAVTGWDSSQSDTEDRQRKPNLTEQCAQGQDGVCRRRLTSEPASWALDLVSDTGPHTQKGLTWSNSLCAAILKFLIIWTFKLVVCMWWLTGQWSTCVSKGDVKIGTAAAVTCCLKGKQPYWCPMSTGSARIYDAGGFGETQSEHR